MEAIASSSIPSPVEPDPGSVTVLDVRGQSCPMPIVRISQAFTSLPTGAVLEVLVTDRGALSDIPSWARTTGNSVLAQDERDGALRFVLAKGTR
jgi:TusA-related sulfurtransferase